MNRTIGLVLAVVFAGSVSAGDAAKGKEKSVTCASCHGPDGNSPLAINPKLAGQSEKYLVKQLKEFKSGARKNATMAPMASMLSDEDIEHVAAFYASQKVQHAAVNDEYIQLGQRLYRGGDADRDIPACIACHGPKGQGMPAAGFPALGGQHPGYTKAQLLAFRDGSRDNDLNSVMRDIVAKMSDQQIEALSQYLVGLH
ncbi:c-type cytochrome [Aliikangiella coralliicola]|uniref:Cytochrome c4 n=1 Tax=Aliikangiella coralliicola TaxID=2592383 RepID=A0A545UI40_9GAMM|nr:c-type cytochrome [Aliikangiella coralliicola]TQV89136.1 cytochrome c4 [Aliikangiella coralliicola]